MKKFLVSKDDSCKLNLIQNTVYRNKIRKVWIICDKRRHHVFESVNGEIMPLRKLRASLNWIKFRNGVDCENDLLVIDEALKFIFKAEGSKKDVLDVVQSLKNVIVMDIVPFYSDVGELFYPMYMLGKGILGYATEMSFRSNYKEEGSDGIIRRAHSFSILKDKIKDYYTQTYRQFFEPRTIVEWEMSSIDISNYEKVKMSASSEEGFNPIKLYNTCSEAINLIQTKFDKLNEITRYLTQKTCVAINCLGIYPKMYKAHLENKNIDFLSIHSKPECYLPYDVVILAEMPIVKPHDWLEIEATLKGKQIIQMQLTNNKLEQFFYGKIFNNALRNEFDNFFYSEDL